jgi:hypothetical protein
MGRRGEFHGAAYGNFEPEPVDLDLSDKVTDHPFYSQPSHYEFHEPDEPKSETCMEPGCGRRVHEHKAMYLPPTRESAGLFREVIEGRKTERREASERAAHTSHAEDQHMQSHHGIAPHFMSGRGWVNEKGPSSKRALSQHLHEDHYVHKEDVREMESPATSHARWHASQEYGGEEHHHHVEQKRYKAEDE